MNGDQLALVARCEIAPGHEAVTSKNTHWRGYPTYRAKCTCGWRSGDNRIKAHTEADLISHWQAAVYRDSKGSHDG